MNTGIVKTVLTEISRNEMEADLRAVYSELRKKNGPFLSECQFFEFDGDSFVRNMITVRVKIFPFSSN